MSKLRDIHDSKVKQTICRVKQKNDIYCHYGGEIAA
jgi:hypothetical protein